jgi:hypothetical protein
MSTWQEAYAELEEQIHDLPRWAHIVQTLHDAKFGPGMDVPAEREGADNRNRRALKPCRQIAGTYQRQLDDLTGQGGESATTATGEAAAERSR